MGFSVRNMGSVADLILFNAKLFASDSTACAVAIQGSQIISVGSNTEIVNLLGKSTEVVNCEGNLLLPGFVDSHCHLLAMASTLTGVNCSPNTVHSRESLIEAIKKAAERTPQGHWVKAFGYDERSLNRLEHPTRWDLDEATIHHPVRLDHRSGHATVLNTKGLEKAGILSDTPDPIGGVIDRDHISGQPTGVLYELNNFLRDAIGDTKSDEEFKTGVQRLNQSLLGNGITSVNDAGHTNGLRRWKTFKELREANILSFRVAMMVGEERLQEMEGIGLSWGSGDSYLRIGHVKLMLTMTTGLLSPNYEDLVEQIIRAHTAGFPVAIHAVEQEAVSNAVNALLDSPSVVSRTRQISLNSTDNDASSMPIPRDRIEHCSECPPSLLASIKRSAVVISTQPGFLYWNGDRYLESVDPDLLPYLYPVGELSKFGISLAFSSDSPVIPPDPWYGIYSAVTGLSEDGKSVTASGDVKKRQGVNLEEALKAYSYGGAFAEGTEDLKGHIRAGQLADIILVQTNPMDSDPRDWLETEVLLTMIGGQIVWEKPV